MWKQYIVLFGGFYDPGMTSNGLDSFVDMHSKLMKILPSTLPQ